MPWRLLQFMACIASLVCVPVALGQASQPSTGVPRAPSAAKMVSDGASGASPSRKGGKGKRAPKPRKKKAAPPKMPEFSGPVSESTSIVPEVTYRMLNLKQRKHSVFHDTNDQDYADQIYVTVRFARTYDYVHEVVIEPAFRTIRENPVAWDREHVMEQAYIESALTSHLTLTAGKKTEYAGPGFFVNPSDLLNEGKELFDPLYQKEGTVFARLRFRWSDFSLGLGYIPKRGLAANKGRAWLQAGLQLFDVDLNVQATHQEDEKTTVGLSAQRFFGSSFELHTDNRYQQRQRDQRQGSTSPTAYSTYARDPSTNADDDPSSYFLTGVRYVFTHQRTLVLEYIQNQSGLMPEELERYFADLREMQAENKVQQPPTTIIGRRYAFAAYQDDGLIPKVQLSLNALQNINDQSVFAALIARYHLSPITSIELAPVYYHGEPNTEFGERPFSRVTYLSFRGRF